MPRAASLVLALGVLSACAERPAERVLEVIGMEYAFQVPDSVDAGRTVVRLRNDGKVLHEMIVMKLQRGSTVKDLIDAQAAALTVRPFIEGGNAVLFAPPAKTGDGELVVNFEPGRDYVLWCNFTDGEGKPQHATLGMFKRIHVRDASPASAALGAQVVNVDAGDYAFRLPDTLPAGLTEFRMQNTGAQRHEISFARIKRGATASFFMSEYLQKRNIDSLYDNDGAILTAYAGDTNRFAMRAQLESGRSYILLCEFQDTPDSPVHATLGMFKEIVVR
ncbi:MAG: hypothetical protein H7066_20470 [Cytophagaceae bacterium]|nr:hypothetical protein [Gemmatimonadaceae bacterium]